MTGPEDRWQVRPGALPGRAGQEPPDVVELGDHRLAFLPGRLPRIAVILAAVGLVAGLGAGFAAGYQRGRASVPHPRSHPSATAVRPAPVLPPVPALIQDAGLCSAQSPGKLQLGVQVLNQSAAPLRLRRVGVVAPLGALRPAGYTWGTCGETPVALAEPVQPVPPGGSTWFTVTVRVRVRCPAADPVQFRLRYEQHGHQEVAVLPGFTDLASVPYQGCPAR